MNGGRENKKRTDEVEERYEAREGLSEGGAVEGIGHYDGEGGIAEVRREVPEAHIKASARPAALLQLALLCGARARVCGHATQRGARV